MYAGSMNQRLLPPDTVSASVSRIQIRRSETKTLLFGIVGVAHRSQILGGECSFFLSYGEDVDHTKTYLQALLTPGF